MISGWRKYLFESMPVSFRQEAMNDPSMLIKYVENNIILDEYEARGSWWGIVISPRGVHELKVSDAYSRDIYFAALCRSLGIPSRLGRGNNGDIVPQYYFGGEWHDAWLAGKNQPQPGKGFIKFSYSERDPVPEYASNFSIARFENGRYNTVFTKVDFKDELALAPGHYMLVTGNKVNDSKILAALSFFELKENEHKAIDVKLRRWSRNTKDVGLYIAALSGDLANVKRLTQEGSDVDRKDEWGGTALYWAMRGKQKEVAEFLIAHGANVNVKGEKDLTPLHLAITNNQKELIETLIARGADVNAKGEKGQTPLHLAIANKEKDVVELLLTKGADVNAKDNWAWTPLHSAVFQDKAMVELLIARGVNVNARDGGNKTPLWRARKHGYTEIVELLRKNGGVE